MKQEFTVWLLVRVVVFCVYDACNANHTHILYETRTGSFGGTPQILMWEGSLGIYVDVNVSGHNYISEFQTNWWLLWMEYLLYDHLIYWILLQLCLVHLCRLFTEVPLTEVERLEKLKGKDINDAKVCNTTVLWLFSRLPWCAHPPSLSDTTMASSHLSPPHSTLTPLRLSLLMKRQRFVFLYT